MTILQKIDGKPCGCDAPGARAGLVSVDDALDLIARHAVPVRGTDRVALADALGRVLAEPVCALADMPRFDHAAMDGYALRRTDLAGPGPWRLPLSMRCAAGAPGAGALTPGTAARIFTGAPIPAGADCVIMQERTVREDAAIVLHARPGAGDNIRFRGEEQARGSQILAPGLRATARGIAAAASAGHGHLTTRRRLMVTLLVSGSEVARPGAPAPGAGQIWDVNTPMLSACLSRADVDLVAVDTLPDDAGTLRRALARAARDSDLVVTTGGVSVGEEDHLRPAVAACGGSEIFAGVAVKPGKPVAFGRIGKAHWLGLPGNPQAAFVTWTLFGEALLKRLTGRTGPGPDRRLVCLAHPVRRAPGRCEIRPARLAGQDALGRDLVECRGGVRSGQVGGLAGADGLVLLPAETDRLAEGAPVKFLPFCET